MAHDPYKMLDNPFRLDGFVVVITGGAGAIGSAAGRLFAHQGADVVICDLNKEGAEKVAREIADATGRKTLGVKTDATKEFLSYSNAKAALHRMTHSMAVMSGPKVRFNTVVIGSVDNGESSEKAGLTKEMQARLADALVMKRRGTPWDIGYAMNYLISPAAQWVTNQEFVIDGDGSYKSEMPMQD